MGVSAGRLRNRVEIMRLLDVDNGKGGYTSTWKPVSKLYAEVVGLDGREAVIGQALQGISVFRVTVRWRRDVLPTDQLRYEGQVLNIKSISDPTGRREVLVILADNEGARPS
jgi:SPP1 family predicted phage head-tail adaptor